MLQVDPATLFKLIEGPDGQLLISIPMDALQREKLPKYYCFAKGRHSGSFFLKVLINKVLGVNLPETVATALFFHCFFHGKNTPIFHLNPIPIGPQPERRYLFLDRCSRILPHPPGALAPELQQADHVRG